MSLRLGAGKDPICLVSMPNKGNQVAVVTSGGADSGGMTIIFKKYEFFILK